MCQTTDEKEKKNETTARQRRGKRDKHAVAAPPTAPAATRATATHQRPPTKRQSRSLQKHQNDNPSGGLSALLPSLVGLVIVGFGLSAKLGFRGRASVAGVDLGTTNSVICVRQQQQQDSIAIDCIPDPHTGTPVIPSVVAFLDASEWPVGPSSKTPTAPELPVHPSRVLVGQGAKLRIDSHPHHTLYNAKRVLGRPARDPAAALLAQQVEFAVRQRLADHNNNSSSSSTTSSTTTATDDNHNDTDDGNGGVQFYVPDTALPIRPEHVGAYVVDYLRQITRLYLGHDNVRSAVICVPAKFNGAQRAATAAAFAGAGLSVARVVEEPTAAALAYGLHRKDGVDYILVYDFGGGTLDISLLHVTQGFVDVMGSDGDDRLGGTDFDDAIAHFLLQERGGHAIVQRAAAVLRQLHDEALAAATSGGNTRAVDLEDALSTQCPVLQETPLCSLSSFHTIGEQLKIALSDAYQADELQEVSSTCLGLPEAASDSVADHGGEWTMESFCSALQPVSLQLTSAEFARVAQHLFDRAILPVQRILHDFGITSKDIDEVVMVGGTTRMPQIRQLVQAALLDSQLNTHIDPDITVAYGAASVID